MTDYSITPPPELIEQWIQIWVSVHGKDNSLGLDYVAAQAARWGYAQGLEAVTELRANSAEALPAKSLVQRVARAIEEDTAPIPATGSKWAPEARAAIREVSAWLAAQSITIVGQAWAEQLRIEAES